MDLLNKLLSIDPNYIIIGFIIFFFSLEQVMKTSFNFKKRVNHLFQNILFQIVLIVLNIFFVTFQVFSIEWLNSNHIGLLYLIELPIWAKLIISSTVFRFHPIELILVFGIGNIFTAALFGTDVFSMALYYFFLYLFFFIEHANLRYPRWLNSTLGLIFVMPDHHRVHHQQDQFYTDSNYADIFIIWDRMFGTFKMMPVEKMKYGLVEFDEDSKQTFLYLI